MTDSAVVYGVAISSTFISGVRLSNETFEVEHSVVRQLETPIIANNGRGILDYPALVENLEAFLTELGDPSFWDPMYISIVPPVLDTQTLPMTTNEGSLKQDLKSFVVQELGLRKDAPVYNQYQLIEQYENELRLAYAGIDGKTLNGYLGAFHEVGVHVISVDLMPLSILRGVAASGVLDKLSQHIGPTANWGCIGVQGTVFWIMLFQGPYVKSLTLHKMPLSPFDAQQVIQRELDQAGVEDNKFWFAWQTSPEPFVLVDLDLGAAPIKNLQLGGFYAQKIPMEVFPSLGASLKSEVTFPLAWNFLKEPETEEIQEQYRAVPYEYYQPVLPKLIFMTSFLLFLVVVGAYGFFWSFNHGLTGQFLKPYAQYNETLLSVGKYNGFYPNVFNWLNQKALQGIRLTHVSAMQKTGATEFNVQGRAFSKDSIESFLTELQKEDPASPFTLEKKICAN